MARPKKNTNTQALADKMRKAVLQAAIEGKLTEQNPSEDGYARDLLAQIETEKQRLIKAGEIKRQKTLPPITEEEKPFDIPDNWEWVRLGDLTYNRGQKKPDTEFSYIDIASIDNKTQTLNLSLEIINPSQAPSRARKIVNKGDIIYATVRPYLMNITIIDRDIEPEPIVSTGFAILTTPYQVTNEYLFHVLMSPHFSAYANHSDNSKGVAYPAINDSRLMNGAIPMPPIAEQQRIVAKLKAALAQIDSLHADENALYALQTAFPKQMQASLLQAAIEGKLTQQDATKDGSASDLLADIETEKQRLIKAGEIRRQKTLPPITEEEKPFDIPDNWEWVRLGELTYNRGQKKPDQKFSYIDIASIDNKTQSLHLDLDIISPSEAPSRARKIINKGDIIYATVRPYLMNITIIDRDIEPEPIASTGFAVLITPYQVTNKYLFRVLMSPYFDLYANHNDNAKGVAYPAINDTRLMNGLIPLPPLAEQQRIVDLLDQALPEIQALKNIA